MKLPCCLLVTLAWAGLFSAPARATIYLEDDYSTFANGNLEGQGGYALTGTPTSNPIQVSDGKVVFPGSTANDQDLYRAFPALISAPTTSGATTSILYGLRMVMNSVSLTATYFTAFNESLAGSGFSDARLGAVTTGTGTYKLGIRVNGQAGYPFAYGGDLNLGEALTVIVKLDLIQGTQNDVISIFVNPTSNVLADQTPYATGIFAGSGAATDPAAEGSFILSQFGSVSNPGNAFYLYRDATGDDFSELYDFLSVPVPEPGVAALLGMSGMLVVSARGRGRGRRVG